MTQSSIKTFRQNTQPIHLNLSAEITPVVTSVDDLKRRLISVFKKLEDHINSQTDIYYIDENVDVSQIQFRAGDVVVDATLDKNFITIYEFNGKTKKSISFSSFAGTLPIISNETPSGLINSTNKDYMASRRFVFKTTRVYLNGLRQRLGFDYLEDQISLKKISFITAPTSGNTIVMDYELG